MLRNKYREVFMNIQGLDVNYPAPPTTIWLSQLVIITLCKLRSEKLTFSLWKKSCFFFYLNMSHKTKSLLQYYNNNNNNNNSDKFGKNNYITGNIHISHDDRMANTHS